MNLTLNQVLNGTPWFVHAVRTFLLISVGLAFEVIFTAAWEYRKSANRRLMGYTYVWMIPIYATVYPALIWLYPKTSAYNWFLRGSFYVAIIYAVEYSSGWLIRKAVGECPWESGYRGSRWSVNDLIRLDFYPAWLCAALLFEGFYRVLVGLY
jgi:hypothetical protein